MTTEFRISLKRQGLLFAAVLVGTLFFAAAMVNTWGDWIQGGFFLTTTLGLGAVAAALGMTLITRPVMVRVSSDGIFIQRLNTLIPWEALSAIRVYRFKGEGNRMVELVEAEGGHPVFRSDQVARGTRLSEMAELPPLTIDFVRTEGSAPEFLDAVRAVGPAQAKLIEKTA